MKKSNNTQRRAFMAAITPILAMFFSTPCSAAGLMDSVLFTGLLQLVNDLSAAAMILCPVSAGVCWVVFAIRRQMADDQDEKRWTKRMTGALIFGVIGCLGGAFISLVSGYFTVS